MVEEPKALVRNHSSSALQYLQKEKWLNVLREDFRKDETSHMIMESLRGSSCREPVVKSLEARYNKDRDNRLLR